MADYIIEHDSSDGTWWVRGGEGATIACTTEAGAERVLAALVRVEALEEGIRRLESVRAETIEACANRIEDSIKGPHSLEADAKHNCARIVREMLEGERERSYRVVVAQAPKPAFIGGGSITMDGVPPDPLPGTFDARILESCARAAHEANRAYCIAMGDTSQVPWEEAPEWQCTSAVNGVRGVLLDGNGPRQWHESWLYDKRAAGWKFGPVKDAAKKEHPCFRAYDELPPEQKMKDDLFVTVVMAMAKALRFPAGVCERET